MPALRLWICWLLIALVLLQGLSALGRTMFAPAHFHNAPAPGEALVHSLLEGGGDILLRILEAGTSHRHGHGAGAHHHDGVAHHSHGKEDTTAVYVVGADDGMQDGARPAQGADNYWMVLPTPTGVPDRAVSARLANDNGGFFLPWSSQPAERPPRAMTIRS